MTSSLLLMLASCLPNSAATDQSPFDRALTEPSAWVVRAQSPSGDVQAPLVAPPGGVSTYYPPPYQAAPVQDFSAGGDPFANPASPVYPAPLQDPWAGSGAAAPYAVPGQPQGFTTYGANGLQPVRYGWQERVDLTWIPAADVSAPATGDFEVFGLDVEKILVTPLANNATWSIGPQFSYRSWQGPSGTPAVDLPGAVYRFGLDMRLRSGMTGGWSYELGFNPALATDFRETLTSDAYLWDGHAVAFWQMSPQWMLAIGALYWDRVDDIVLPYAGAVWRPSDIWEFRLIFPKPRISVFVGAPWGVPTWLYTEAEYHVEAYQVRPKLFADETRVQIEDWRVVGGLRWETGTVTSFVEAGYIFDREVEYKNLASDFDVDSGFIGRLGFRF